LLPPQPPLPKQKYFKKRKRKENTGCMLKSRSWSMIGFNGSQKKGGKSGNNIVKIIRSYMKKNLAWRSSHLLHHPETGLSWMQ